MAPRWLIIGSAPSQRAGAALGSALDADVGLAAPSAAPERACAREREACRGAETRDGGDRDPGVAGLGQLAAALGGLLPPWGPRAGPR